MNTRAIAAAVIAAAAGSSQAARMSFSSSSGGGTWTFRGNGNSVTDATAANAPIVLDIDDNNGPLPTLNVSTQFDAAFSLSFQGTTSLGGGVLDIDDNNGPLPTLNVST